MRSNPDPAKETFAAVFGKADPVRGTPRVPTTTAAGSARSTPSARGTRAAQLDRSEWNRRDLDESPRFVVEWEEGAVTGFREDAGAGALLPLRRAGWEPQARLDLHGKRVHELDDALDAFMSAAVEHGFKRLLVIHGKGVHSPGGAGVLSEALVRLLTNTGVSRWVRAFRSAPSRLGGSGALALEIVKRRVVP